MASLDDVVKGQKRTNTLLTIMVVIDVAIFAVAGAYVYVSLHP